MTVSVWLNGYHVATDAFHAFWLVMHAGARYADLRWRR
jgi:hypothetical protein